MSCPYQFYKDGETYYPMLYCSITNKSCLYRKKCGKERKYIPVSGDERCNIMLNNIKKDIPNGSYYIRTSKKRPNGTYSLYIDIDNSTIKVDTDIKELNQNYVYLSKDFKTASLTPIKKSRTKKSETE